MTERGEEAPRAKKQKTGGFKWKEKKANDSLNDGDRPAAGLQRGYRDRSPRRDSYRDKSPRRDDNELRSAQDENKSSHRVDYRDRSPRRYDDDDAKPRDRAGSGKLQSKDVEGSHDNSGLDRSVNKGKSPNDTISQSTAEKFGLPASKSNKKDKPKRTPKPAVSSEPMIIVNINDRLGTKAAIPCFASDNVKLFKAQVAARIGRQPHEIMLKRQGERPFKDSLTLEDYGVSSGVQLDLEIDTGD